MDEEFFDSSVISAKTDYVRPKLRMVAGGVPMIEDEEYPMIVNDSYVSESENDSWFDSARAFEARLEARVDDGYWGRKAPFLTAVEPVNKPATTEDKSKLKRGKRKAGIDRARNGAEKTIPRYPGLKKHTVKQASMDLPPTPRGCEWRRSDEGLNLWRYWTEWDGDRNQRIKKSRYAGHLSDDAWRIMKEYDHEAFISIVGERLRRYSGR